MYQSFYNLTGKPFRLSPDPAFFFPSRGHKRALAYLRYGLHQNEGFVVITGSPGIGKTTLAQILLNEMGEKNVVVAHLTTTQLEADDMLRMVSASFGLRYENLDKAALLKGIESFLLARSRENKRALLVIDEAQNLPMRSLEELRMLSNLQVGDKALLQTFLLGQVQFRNMLENEDLEQLRQRVIANFHLGPLAADESQRYIESRLHHVGWKGDPAFAEIAFEKIHEYTEGVPRRINMLCDRILLFGCMEEQHNITGEVVDSVRAELEQEVGGVAKAVKPGSYSTDSSKDENKAKKNSNTSSAPQSNKAKPETNTNNVSSNVSPKKSSQSAGNNANSTVSGKQKEARDRAEPELPADFSNAIDSDSEQFIDITQDFIDKFDASITKAKETRSQNVAAEQKERKEKVSTPTSDKDNIGKGNASSDDVLGNTVKRKNPDVSETGDNDGHIEINPEPTQISERDLFRVIPGGKDNRGDQTEEIKPASLPNPAMSPAASASPSSEDVVLRRILRLVLAFHRSPSSFPGLDDPSQPLPEGVSELLELAVADDEVLTKVSPAAVMGISPIMLRAAVRFFIRRTLFANDSDHFRMLGLTSNAQIADIERHYDLLMRLLRQDKQPGAAECVDKVGRSYEALMRLDDPLQLEAKADSRSISSKPASKKSQSSESSDEKAAAVLEALENPELTIDFSDDDKAASYQPKQKPVSAFVGYGTENYIPDPRITRRRIHLLGQAAILGIGALVVVLGIFITQLEPDNVGEKKSSQLGIEKEMVASAQQESSASADSSERRLDLSFNDGSSESLSENFSTTRGSDESLEASKESPKVVFDDTPSNPKEATKPSVKAQAAKPVPVQEKPAVSRVKVTEKKQAEKVTVSSSSQFKTVPVTTKNNSGASGSTASEQQSKFTAVPVATKPDIEQQTVADIAQKDAQQETQSNNINTTASSATADNKFPGKDVPVKPANVSGGAMVSGASDESSITNASAITQSATMSPIEAALSDSGAENQADEAGQSTTVAAGTSSDTSAGGSALSINDFQLNQLLKNFSNAYETGDLNKLMSLFANDARTNTQTTRSGIEREYKTLFSSTASRNITLIAPLWNNEGRFARGVGQYSITIVPQGGEAYTSNGKYTLQAYLDAGKVIISRFYFSNEVTVNRKAVLAGSPSHSELKNLLTSFTRYYEGAQLDNLMGLFANNAQTNDQNTLAGIRKDHDDLFKSTQQRQIFLKDVQWQIKDKTATGKGKFEVMVQSNGQESFASVTGIITIEAEKSDNGLKITKFLHKAN